MGRPAKSLAARVVDRSFEPRRHRRLLDGPLVDVPALRELQVRYRAEDSETERRRLAREFRDLLLDLPEASVLERIRAVSYPEFTEAFLRDPKGHRVGKPFMLEPFQRDFDREFSRRDADGSRVYTVGLLGVPRGNGKTADAAARSLYELLRRPNMPEVFFAASSKDQARIAFGFASAFVRGSGLLREVVEVQKDRITVPETGAVMTILPATGTTAYGLAPTVAVVDELWTWRQDAQHELWDALLTATQKAPDAFLLALTTAPEEARGSLLGELLEQELGKPGAERPHDALTVVRDAEAGTLTMWYGAPLEADLDDEDLWRRSNPASFKDVRGMRKLRRQMKNSPGKFALLHLNQIGAEDDDALVPREMLEACRAGDVPPLMAGTKAWVGLEAGFGKESMAAAIVARLDDEKIACWVQTWSTNPDVPATIRPPGAHVDHVDMEIWLNSLDGQLAIETVAYDPATVLLQPETMREHGYPVTEVLAASKDAMEASRSLYRLLLDGELVHDLDSNAAAQITNTRGEWDRHERLAVFKRNQSGRIDVWYALANAVFALGEPEREHVFDWIEHIRKRSQERSRERSVSPEEAHRHTNVEPGLYSPLSSWSPPNWPSNLPAQSWPSIGEPDEP
jgi:phage terminase large subunit-like protein